MNKDDIEEIVDSLDLKGVACPFNYVQTKIRLEEMDAGELLEITIDDGEPIKNVPQVSQMMDMILFAPIKSVQNHTAF